MSYGNQQRNLLACAKQFLYLLFVEPSHDACAQAQVSGLQVGELVHVIADCHIYDRHVDLVKKMLDNPTFEAPKFEVDPTVTDFYAFTKDSFKMVDYQCNKFDYEIPIAI